MPARANGRIFLLMVGVGFDAEVVHRLHRRRRGRHISYWTWARPILEAIGSYSYPDLRVYCRLPGETSEQLEHSARWAFVVNLPAYAAGLRVAPEAVGTDGLFSVATFASGSFWHGLRYIGHVLLRRHHRLPDFTRLLASHVRIESDRPVPYQLDGDPGGELPLEVEMLPGRVLLWVPKQAAASLGLEAIERNPAGA